MKWHLSIQNKIYLLGAIASLGLIVFLILVYAGKLELYFSQRAVVAQVCLTGINLSLVHELQKERGRSAGYLAKPTHENFALYRAKQQGRNRVVVELG